MANIIRAASRREVLKISALSSVSGLLSATRTIAHPRSTALTIDSQVLWALTGHEPSRLTYKQGVEAFRVTDRLSDSDRAMLMGETLSRVYNWSPSKA
jgi:hypothetical protein